MRLADCFPNGPPATADTRLRCFDWAGHGIAIPYVIFTTGRCGSTLLTHLLGDTGLCGWPDEYFNEKCLLPLCEAWEIFNFPDYFAAIVDRSATNRRFGFEIDPFRFEQLHQMAAFGEVFPAREAVFFWMTRRDIVGQAWSYAKAKKGGVWHLYADGGEARTDAPEAAIGPRARIDDGEWWRELLLLLRGERIVEAYFAEAGITPYRLDYEMLVTDKYRVVTRVLQALRCAPDEIERQLTGLSEKTLRQEYDDWRPAVIGFCDRYRDELRQIERSRHLIDPETLRRDLIANHGLAL